MSASEVESEKGELVRREIFRLLATEQFCNFMACEYIFVEYETGWDAMQAEESRETKRLSTLLELNKALTGTLNLKHSLHRVLEILEQRHGMFMSTVMLMRGIRSCT